MIQVNEPGMTLKHLKADDYHTIFDERVEAGKSSPDVDEARCSTIGPYGTCLSSHFRKGQVVTTPEGDGTIDGIATENGIPTSFVRVNGRLYHWTKVKHR